MAIAVVDPRPLILIACSPAEGHFGPCRVISKELVKYGYEVTFICGRRFQPAIEATGATFVPIAAHADYTTPITNERFPGREAVEAGIPRMLYDFEHIFIGCMPAQFQSVQDALKSMKESHPGRKIALMYDATYFGALPLGLNSRGIIPDAMIGIGHACLFQKSIDTAPFGTGLPPDSSPEGRERNIQMQKGMDALFAPVTAMFAAALAKEGADSLPESGISIFEASFVIPERWIQLCTQSVEYPRSDLRPNIVFTGGLPKGSKKESETKKPEWWEEVKLNPSKKKIVFVSQGTVAVEYEQLLIPTMEVFADRDDVLIIAALGVKGVSLAADVNVPCNARVVDFIPFEEIIPLSDVFVTNGGYGGFQHALTHGCPLVIAGDSEDKPEVAARAEYTGVGVNLHSGSPSKEVLKEGIEKVLSDASYKEKVMAIKKEMDAADPMAVVEKAIADALKIREEKKKDVL